MSRSCRKNDAMTVERLSALRQRYALFLRFLAVGLLNTMFGYTAFAVLLWAGLTSGLALVVAWVIGVLFNFGTIRMLVFTGESGSLVSFAMVYIGILLVNWITLALLERAGIPAWIAQGGLTFPLALVSYSAQKRLVFALA
jgi:putative flippase GtrA